MNAVRCLFVSLLVSTITQTTYAMQQTQQLDINTVDLLEKALSNQDILAAEFRNEYITKVNAITNQQQLARVRNELKRPLIITILQKPLSAERELQLLHHICMAIISGDLSTVQFIAANVDATDFTYLIHHSHLVCLNKEGKRMILPTAYKLAQDENQKIAAFFDKYFPSIK